MEISTGEGSQEIVDNEEKDQNNFESLQSGSDEKQDIVADKDTPKENSSDPQVEIVEDQEFPSEDNSDQLTETAKDDEIPSEEKIEEDTEPTIWLLRGDDTRSLTTSFIPMDLMTIIIFPTGSHRQTSIKMKDNMDQYRYHGKAGGISQKFETRLQQTRSFGTWKLEIELPIPETEDIEEVEVEFDVVESVEEIEELEVTPIDTPTGTLLQFHEQEEEMFKIVDRSIFEPKEPEVPEEPEEIEAPAEPVEEIEEEVIPKEEEITEEPPLVQDLTELEIPVTEISGIGPATSKKLEKHNIVFVHHFVNKDPDEVAEFTGLSSTKLLKWITQANEIASDPENEIYLEYSKTVEKAVAEPVKEEIEEIVNDNLEELQIPLKEIRGIGPATASKMNEAGIEFVHHLLDYNPVSLSEEIGVSDKKTVKWLDQVKEIATDPENDVYLEYSKTIEKVDAEPVKEKIEEIVNDDLEELQIPLKEITGVGPATASKMNEAGIEFVHHLLDYNPVSLSEEIGVSDKKTAKWLDQVKEIATDPENEVYKSHKRLKIPAGDSDTEIVGIPVNEIKGIGPATKEKLNNVDIFFAHELASWSPADLAESIGVSQTRCEKWIDRAKEKT